MITLVTGTPGAGKTLFTINRLKDINDRPIYYQRIKDLKLNWIKLSNDEFKEWWTLPPNSIVVLDEAQFSFPLRSPSRQPPDFVENLTTHRHQGIDFYLITQNAKLLDVFVRRLIGTHYHYKRQFGLEAATEYCWQELADTDDRGVYFRAIKKRVHYPKDVYKLYHSAEIHTVKKNIPFKIYLLFILIIFILGLFYFVFTFLGSSGDVEEDKENSGLFSGIPSSELDQLKSDSLQDKPKQVYNGNVTSHSIFNAEIVTLESNIVVSGKNYSSYKFYSGDKITSYSADALGRLGFEINRITSCLHRLSYNHITYLTECNLEIVNKRLNNIKME